MEARQEGARLAQRYDREHARTPTEIDRLREGKKEHERALRGCEIQRDKMRQQLRAAHSTIERLTAELHTAERVHAELMTSLAASSRKTADHPRKEARRRSKRRGSRSSDKARAQG